MSRRKTQPKSEAKGTSTQYSPKSKGKSGKQSDVINPKPDDTVNDENWYYLDPVLMEQTSNMQMSNMVDKTVEMPVTAGVATTPGSVNVGNIMRLSINPCLGISPDSPASKHYGVNAAGLKTYTLLSADNAKTTQYAPQDVTMCILAVGELIAGISVAKRALGVAYYYNKRNFAFPLTLINAMGFTANDLIKNFADYRTRLNIFITRCNQISIPANIAWFAKQDEYYKYVFKDTESEMAQTFFWTRNSFWKLDETTDPNGSMLSVVAPWNNNDNTQISFADFLQHLDDLLDALLTSSTYNYIYADVLKAADKKGVPLYTFELVPTDYLVVPAYNETASLQLRNAMIIGTPMATALDTSHTNGNEVHTSVDNNIVVYSPTWKHSIPFANKSCIIDFDYDNPTVKERVEATRMAAVGVYRGSYDSTNEWQLQATGFGDMYVTRMSIFQTDGTRLVTFAASALPETYSIATLLGATVLSQFHCAPRIVYYDAAGENAVTTGRMLGDLNYYTTVDQQYMRNVNNISLLSLLTVR